MTWTKLGDEFPAAARKLTDAEFRTHVEALCWSALRLLDLEIPKAEVRRFAESPDAETAVEGLAAKGWWEDNGSCWHIGARFAEWQLERAVAEKRRQDDALRQRRRRMHKAGDHRLCLPGNCPAVTRDDMRDVTRAQGRDGSGPTDPSVPSGQNQGAGPNRVGDPIADKTGSGFGSAANSENHRVHPGSFNGASQAQQNSDPVTPRSPAADRNARELCGRCGERPGGNGGRSFCQPCIAEVNEENRQLGERMDKLRAQQEAELAQVQTWTSDRLVQPRRGTRRVRETVNVSRHPAGWPANPGHERQETCNAVFDAAAAGQLDEFREFHDRHPVIWKCEQQQRRTRVRVYYCDAHLPDEFRPVTAVAP